ncbi:hypothetical protein [Gloeobacter morelensis]|uniref:Aldose epimerase n=1 Tax=Gloeobacter morelensis MG652769 TaxID=2781736 RepID=A0ABY3PL63_9CYAN|nr:hypothetical protein [Gloeobacter morelensis]UFP94406.1 aldose epimerase [Gloeobacter morelensis MG652769]
MFQVQRETGPFGECRLVDSESDATVRVAPGRGGMVSGFTLAGRDLLYLDLETYYDPARSVRGGNPILFPICGNLPNDIYTVAGQPYILKQHGLARTMAWQVVEESTVGAAGLTLELASDEATRERYPFDFTVRFTYLLRGGELTIRQEYDNRSERPLPMYAGFHPYFVCTDKSKLRFDLPASRYIDQLTGKPGNLQTGFPFDAPSIDWLFTDVHAQQAAVTSPADGYRVALRYDPVFAFLVFWTLKDKPFYCLEPWMAPRNAMNTGDHLQMVPPGDRLHAEISLAGEIL